MNAGPSSHGKAPGANRRVLARQIGGLLVLVVLVVWLLLNRDQVDVSLIFGVVAMPLWLALALAAAIGALIGFLLARRAYRR